MIVPKSPAARKLEFPAPPGAFPLLVQRQTPQAELGLHTHQFEELVVITGGRGTHFTAAAEYPIQAGDVFVIHTGQAHGYRDTERLHLVNVLYKPAGIPLPQGELRKLPGYHALFNLEPRYRRRHRFESRLQLRPEELAQAGEWLEGLEAELAARQPGFEFLALAHFMRLVGTLSRRYADGGEEGGAGKRAPLIRLGRVFGHLESRYAEPVRVAQLCAIARMSRSALFRAFHDATGLAPLDYLIRLRVARARDLLRRTPLPIKEVAARTGFRDSNYLARQYRRITGETPRTTRRRATAAAITPRRA
ncbi:MAG: AraC family transcriptional regulator [Lentisphaeria bacterium]